MNEEKQYWRDRVLQLLGWGTAGLAVIAAWSIDKSANFEIGPWAAPTNWGDRIRGAAILLFSVVFGVGWFWSVKWIYDTHLRDGIDSTVLPVRAAKAYAAVVAALLMILASFIALF